jgi:Fe-Mn family superoxide dismutase
MAYQAKDFSRLLGMEGLSDTLLKNHFSLYEGYVKNTNALLQSLKEMLQEGSTGPQYAELKRRLGWEFNGMRLHEYYFEALGGDGLLPSSGALAEALKASFGSPQDWLKDFKAMGMMRGIGWVALYQDTTTGRLINFWINEHDGGHPGGLNLILIMDVFEHAFMLDYGLKKADYIEAFLRNLNYQVLEARLK